MDRALIPQEYNLERDKVAGDCCSALSERDLSSQSERFWAHTPFQYQATIDTLRVVDAEWIGLM